MAINNYYFGNAMEQAKELFSEEKVSLSGKLSKYVEEVINILEKEYNATFKDFLDESTLTCKDVKEAMDGEVEPVELVDVAFESFYTAQRTKYIDNVITGNKRKH